MVQRKSGGGNPFQISAHDSERSALPYTVLVCLLFPLTENFNKIRITELQKAKKGRKEGSEKSQEEKKKNYWININKESMWGK